MTDRNILVELNDLQTEVAALKAKLDAMIEKDEYVLQILEGYVDGINILNAKVLELEEKLP